jgi:hypothetical protein
MDGIDLEERSHRFSQIMRETDMLDSHDLVKAVGIDPVKKLQIIQSLNVFLWATLCSHFKTSSFNLCSDMLEAYTNEVMQLPNITPNGLILPKYENQLAYNQFHKTVVSAFSDLNLVSNIARVQYPINIRIQSGTPDPKIDNRARASVKPHSDIWAADPPGGMMVFLALLGDTKNSGIQFMNPSEFPESFVKPLADYNEGAPVVESSQLLKTEFDDRGWFFTDPYLIHRTTKNGSGYRISLDFRFVPTAKIRSDYTIDEARDPYFIPYQDWSAIGSTKLITTAERMADFRGDNKKFTTGYPVELNLIEAFPQMEACLA